MSDERERIEAIVQTAIHEAVDAAAEADPHYASSQWTAEGLTEIQERAVEALLSELKRGKPDDVHNRKYPCRRCGAE